MKSSSTTRRKFLQSSGAFVAGTTSLVIAQTMGETDAHEASFDAQGVRKQSEDGVIYHRDLQTSNLMQGFPPPHDRRVTIDNWHENMDTVRYTQLHEDRIFRTVAILPDESQLWTLPRRMMDPEKLAHANVLWGPTKAEAEKISVADWLTRSQTDAFIAIHDGHIVAEQYFGEMVPHTRHSVWSSSKSVIAMVVAGLIADGRLDEDDLVTKHIPELAGSAFEKATFRQVFDQTTGVELKTFPGPEELETMTAAERKTYELGSWEHRHADHDNSRLLRVIGCFRSLPKDQALGMYDYLSSLRQTRDHGACFYYADANPIAAQWILERVTGTNFIEHMGAVWRQLGAEHMATLKLDQIGTAVGTVGLSMTARDYARLGLMLLNRGRVGSGFVFPGIGDLIRDAQRDPGSEKWTRETNFLGQTLPGMGYKSFFWVTPADGAGRKPNPWIGGLYGQRVYFDQSRDIVLAKFSSNTKTPCREEEVACPSFLELFPDLVA